MKAQTSSFSENHADDCEPLRGCLFTVLWSHESSGLCRYSKLPAATSPLPPSGRWSLIVFYPSHDTRRRQDGSCSALLRPIRRQNWFLRTRLVTRSHVRRTATLCEKHAGPLAGRQHWVWRGWWCYHMFSIQLSWKFLKPDPELLLILLLHGIPITWNQAGCDQNIG